VATYLVELYLLREQATSARAAGARVRAAALRVSREGLCVRYVRTTVVPADETCFHVLEAPSREAVAAVALLASLDSPRILPALE
jgi:hypothetical protein